MSSSTFNQQKVLVTGAAGFIGSNLCEVLISAGAEVTGIDNLLTGYERNLTKLQSSSLFHFIKADVIQPPESYLPADYKPDYIFHFASPASPPLYQAHPIETYLVNSYATHELLQYITRTHSATKFIFASTSEVYGNPLEHPQTETYWGNVNPNGVRSCYDEGKRLGETICGVHARDFDVDTRIVRIFNTYGPKIDLNDGRVIPDFVAKVLNHEPVTIYGDGNQTRSFCYVSDLIEGILTVATHPGCAKGTFNVGNPGEFTINQTVEVFEKILGTSLEKKQAELPQDDPVRRRPDISKLHTLTGWSPTIDFETGIRKTLDYFKSLSV